MRVLPADSAAIAEAGEILRQGGLVAIPTETVYGLAADATNPHAVARIFAAKGRPQFNPLIAHCRDSAQAAAIADLDARALMLAAAFWPGPLTLVAPRQPGGAVCDLACAGLATVAVRVPAHPVARAVIDAAGAPLAAPSANPSGRISPTAVRHLLADNLPDVALVLDGGDCAFGLESTIIAALPGEPLRLLRAGAIPAEAIEAIAGPLASASDGVSAPGMLLSHYAPRARLRIAASTPAQDEIFIGFGPGPETPFSLSPSGDLREAAARLYDVLRQADATGAAAIAVAAIPETGLGAAINDRLARAAAGR